MRRSKQFRGLRYRSLHIFILEMQGTSLVKLQVLHAGLERSMKELERISIGQEAGSSFCLEIVGAVAQEWALEVNRALFEFRRNEVNNPVDFQKYRSCRCQVLRLTFSLLDIIIMVYNWHSECVFRCVCLPVLTLIAARCTMKVLVYTLFTCKVGNVGQRQILIR